MTLRQAKKKDADPILPILIEETSNTEDWARVEKLQMYQDMCSATRDDLAFPDDLMDYQNERGLYNHFNHFRVFKD